VNWALGYAAAPCYLFLHTLQDVYYAENQILKSLPKLIDEATNRELAAGLRNHLRGKPGHAPRAGVRETWPRA
jgi:ferritin-like metal-binding protein YciE